MSNFDIFKRQAYTNPPHKHAETALKSAQESLAKAK